MLSTWERGKTWWREYPLVKSWVESKDNPWWALALLFLGTEYFLDLYRVKTAVPFNYDLFTGTLLIWYQRLLHIPVFIMGYMIFVRRWSWRGLGMTALAVWATTNYALIDVELHKLITHLDLYPQAWRMQNGEANSNYAKIAVCMTVFPLFLIRFLQPSYRTMERFLTLMMAGAVISTSLLFHWVLIEREYKQAVQHELAHIRHVLPVSEQAFREVCAESTWECWIGYPSEQGNPQVTPLMRSGMKKMMASPQCEKYPCLIMSGGTNPAQNEFVPMPMGIMKVDGQWRFVADTSRIAHQFLEIRQGLTSLGIAAGNVWTFGLIFLWAMHQRQWKKRDKQRAEQAKSVGATNSKENQ
jgi:hypothetical protein